MLFKTKNANFALFDKTNEDLYRKVKQNICGGPSIVFTRSMNVGQRLKNGDQTCAKIFGFDANALYPYCLRRDMPCGAFVRRRECNGYRPEIQNKYLDMYVWLDKFSETRNIKIYHKLNSGKEHYVMGFFVDGVCNNEVFEYHGCYYHGCRSCTNKVRHKKTEKWVKTQDARYNRTVLRKKYLESIGYKVHEMWECQFKREFSDTTESIRNKYLPKYYTRHKYALSKDTLLDAIESGELFGMAEVDIEVPDRWQGHFRDLELSPYDYFKEFSPIFCTTDVPFDSIGDHMRQHTIDHDAPTKSRRLLVGGMKANKILLTTPLLQWYLKHGLVITRLYETVEYSPVACFQKFVQQGIDARRQSDNDPDQALLGDTFKILLNSSYGSSLLNKEKFSNTSYHKGHNAIKIEANKPEFKKATLLSDDSYEVEKGKKRIVLDVPIQIGFFILNYAKLRMLEFYYDCLCKYIPRNKFECIQMDTDSLYFALAHENLSDAVHPHLLTEFVGKIQGKCGQTHVADSETFFPRTCCAKDRQYDRRTESLFKEEYFGYSMIALCSKTYVIEKNGQYKLSCKGVNKKSISEPKAVMSKVLKDQIKQSSINRGFRAKDNTMFTYTQERVGFNYYYCKRKVEDDGIHTSPLDLTLTPWPDFNRYTFESDPFNPLCNSFACPLQIENLDFLSVDHFLTFSLVKFHQGEEQALAVQQEISPAEIAKSEIDISVKLAWYVDLEKVLKIALDRKFDQCQEFRNALDSIVSDEIVFADTNSQLGCGMSYDVSILTDSKKFPGRNQLGEMLTSLRMRNRMQ